ncbi:MAG: hypothetical protein V4736_13755 [Bdellovibrionota bacterium]
MFLKVCATVLVSLFIVTANAGEKANKRSPSSNGNLSLFEVCDEIKNLNLPENVKQTCGIILSDDKEIDTKHVKGLGETSPFLKSYWSKKFNLKGNVNLSSVTCQKIVPSAYSDFETVHHVCTAATGESRKFKVCTNMVGSDEDAQCTKYETKMLPAYFHFRVNSEGSPDESKKPVLNESATPDLCIFGKMCAA